MGKETNTVFFIQFESKLQYGNQIQSPLLNRKSEGWHRRTFSSVTPKFSLIGKKKGKGGPYGPNSEYSESVLKTESQSMKNAVASYKRKLIIAKPIYPISLKGRRMRIIMNNSSSGVHIHPAYNQIPRAKLFLLVSTPGLCYLSRER